MVIFILSGPDLSGLSFYFAQTGLGLNTNSYAIELIRDDGVDGMFFELVASLQSGQFDEETQARYACA